jgi:hypothetical protein
MVRITLASPGSPRRRRLGLTSIAVAFALALAVPSATLAAVSSSYAIRGFEVAATSTVGTFVGTASGTDGDSAAWRAVVEHTPLTTQASVTGGNAQLVTSDGTTVRGSFTGGKVKQLTGLTGCENQTYKVVGRLSDVRRSDTGEMGSGTFEAKLTHHRASILGRCIVYSATVRGTLSLSF